MATRTRSDAQKFTHDNYALTTSDQTRTLPSNCTSLLIDNVDSSISVLVSFDAGATHKTLKAGAALSLDCDGLKSYAIKSASATPSVECLYGSEA
jgi:hypothetical protein